jgi:hypothetical protein
VVMARDSIDLPSARLPGGTRNDKGVRLRDRLGSRSHLSHVTANHTQRNLLFVRRQSELGISQSRSHNLGRHFALALGQSHHALIQSCSNGLGSEAGAAIRSCGSSKA